MSPQGQGGKGGDGGASVSPAMKKMREEQSLSALSIRMLQNAEYIDTGKIKVDGKDVSKITIVGNIVNVDITQMNVTYMVDDGSGIMYVRQYIEEGKSATYSTQTYVRAYGQLKSVKGEKSNIFLGADRIIPITDFNEIAYHGIEVIHHHCIRMHGPLGGVPEGGGDPIKVDGGYGGNANSAPQAHGGGGSGGGGGGDTLNIRIIQIFNQTSAEEGLSVHTVQAQLPGVTMAEIRKSIEFLTDEGQLYSTIDEDHYRSTSV